MKKLLKNVWLWVGVAILLVGALSFYIIKDRQLFNKQKSGQESTKSGEEAKPTEKTDNAPSDSGESSDTGKPTPVVNTALSELKDVTLTAYLIREETTSADGKTTIAAGSIQPYLYPQGSGIFSVQKLYGSAWLDIASSVNYPGHGGIAGAFTNSTEDNISYRVVKIENGKAAAVSKTFTIKRSDLTDGVKTYN